MFYGHNLRNDLQEWRSRLHRSTWLNFQNEYRHFFQKLKKTPTLLSIVQNTIDQFGFTDEQVQSYFDSMQDSGMPILYENAAQQAAILFLLHTKHFQTMEVDEMVTNFGAGQQLDVIKNDFLENYLDPLVNYLHDCLNEGNGVLYLLEKYKRRTEWFMAKDLRAKYLGAEKGYEQIFEDDLRLYLFDQGIDYPFSTPSSSSGRSDIVGLIDTNDPLIVEIKIFDKNKSYGKGRIASGFAQTVKYAQDYNKHVAYLAIFNMEEIDLQIETHQKDTTFSFRIEFSGKIFHIVIVNLNFDTSSSKLKKLETVTVTRDELIVELVQ
jgi:hypothetical protein